MELAWQKTVLEKKLARQNLHFQMFNEIDHEKFKPLFVSSVQYSNVLVCQSKKTKILQNVCVLDFYLPNQ